MADDAVESWRQLGAGARENWRIGLQDRRHRLGDRLALERAPPSEHLIEDGAERKQIGAGIDGLSPDLFRSHVASGTQHGARIRSSDSLSFGAAFTALRCGDV